MVFETEFLLRISSFVDNVKSLVPSEYEAEFQTAELRTVTDVQTVYVYSSLSSESEILKKRQFPISRVELICVFTCCAASQEKLGSWVSSTFSFLTSFLLTTARYIGPGIWEVPLITSSES
jgi:hypothetical protein